MNKFNGLNAMTAREGPCYLRSTDQPGVEDQRFSLYKSSAGYRAIMDWYDQALETIDCPFESRFVATGFGHTHVLAAGPTDGQPLILVPGVAGCAPLWRRQIPAFAERYRVYAVDIVGQPGRSDPRPLSFLNNDYVAWLGELLDGLQIERAHFAGTSVGGWIVLRMALDAPDRVASAILLSPTGVSRARLPIRIWLTRVLNKRKDADVLEDELTARSVASKSPGGSFGTFDRQLARLMALCTRHFRVDRSLGIYDQQTRKIRLSQGLRVLRKFFLAEPRAELRRLSGPALLVLGEHEVLYQPERVAARARRLMPGIETRIIEGAGHAAIYDQPQAANEVLLDFLARTTPTAPVVNEANAGGQR